MTDEISLTSVTDEQKKEYFRFVAVAVEKAVSAVNLDKDGIQRLIEADDVLSSRIFDSIQYLAAVVTVGPEETKSNLEYPESYKVKGITEQTNILRQLFPGIGFADEKIADQLLPSNAEGWFAIPKWQTLAPTYGEALEKVLAKIQLKWNFSNRCVGRIGSEHLRQHAKTVKMYQKLGDEQKDFDILIVPAQFGLRHRGRSNRGAHGVFLANEFGLGAFAIGIMLLTHPERMVRWKQLQVCCAGDEYVHYGATGIFSCVPLFCFFEGIFFEGIEFYVGKNTSASEYFGSATGFLIG